MLPIASVRGATRKGDLFECRHYTIDLDRSGLLASRHEMGLLPSQCCTDTRSSRFDKDSQAPVQRGKSATEWLCTHEAVFNCCPLTIVEQNGGAISSEGGLKRFQSISPRMTPLGEAQHGMEDWLFDAVAGRRVTLILESFTEDVQGTSVTTWSVSKPLSVLYLNISLTRLTVQPLDLNECPPIIIEIDTIRAVSSTKALLPSLKNNREVRDVLGALDETEKRRAVVVQYCASRQHRFVFLLEASEHARDRFIQELRGIKIDRRLKNM